MFENFSAGDQVKFLFEDTSKCPFDFVGEDLVLCDRVAFALSAELSEDGTGLGEQDVEESIGRVRGDIRVIIYSV